MTTDHDNSSDENSSEFTETLQRLQAELRQSRERELALRAERKSLLERLERQAAWLAWPQYGEIGAASALKRALLEACDIGLSWSGDDTVDGLRLRVLRDLAALPNRDLAKKEGAREEESTAVSISTEAP